MKIFFFTFVVLLLIIPFIIREYNPKFEPYPALLLPAGGKVAKLNKRISTYQKKICFCKDLQEQKWKVVDFKQLLSPMPKGYASYLIDKDFGIKDSKKSNLTKQWLIRKIRPIDCELDSLKIQEISLIMNVDYKLVDTIVLETKFIELN